MQEKYGSSYQWTTQGVEVPLMHEVHVGHVSRITKEECRVGIEAADA